MNFVQEFCRFSNHLGVGKGRKLSYLVQKWSESNHKFSSPVISSFRITQCGNTLRHLLRSWKKDANIQTFRIWWSLTKQLYIFEQPKRQNRASTVNFAINFRLTDLCFLCGMYLNWQLSFCRERYMKTRFKIIGFCISMCDHNVRVFCIQAQPSNKNRYSFTHVLKENDSSFIIFYYLQITRLTMSIDTFHSWSFNM